MTRWPKAICGILWFSLCTVALAGPPVTGELTSVDGVRVLRLWGDAYQRGYAHGNLLGREIAEIIEAVLLDPRVLKDSALYENMIVGQIVPRFEFSADQTRELEGMLDGARAAVGGDALRLERLKRPVAMHDLKAVNTLADWSQFFCSSVSVWGDLSADGGMITARNLDFPPLPGLREKPLVIVYVEAGAKARPWVSISWPSLIGAYTAMNEDGVTISVHDVYGTMPNLAGTFTPRSLALREAIEVANPASAVGDVEAVFRKRHVLCGNNIHVSAPYKGQVIPAAILEYDGNQANGGGVTLRASDASSASATWVGCTNHYRARQAATQCSRYSGIEAELTRLAGTGGKVDVDVAWRLLGSVEQKSPQVVTLQSVLFLPNRGEMLVSLATAEATSAGAKPVRLKLADLLRKP